MIRAILHDRWGWPDGLTTGTIENPRDAHQNAAAAHVQSCQSDRDGVARARAEQSVLLLATVQSAHCAIPVEERVSSIRAVVSHAGRQFDPVGGVTGIAVELDERLRVPTVRIDGQ